MVVNSLTASQRQYFVVSSVFCTCSTDTHPQRRPVRKVGQQIHLRRSSSWFILLPCQPPPPPPPLVVGRVVCIDFLQLLHCFCATSILLLGWLSRTRRRHIIEHADEPTDQPPMLLSNGNRGIIYIRLTPLSHKFFIIFFSLTALYYFSCSPQGWSNYPRVK